VRRKLALCAAPEERKALAYTRRRLPELTPWSGRKKGAGRLSALTKRIGGCKNGIGPPRNARRTPRLAGQRKGKVPTESLVLDAKGAPRDTQNAPRVSELGGGGGGGGGRAPKDVALHDYDSDREAGGRTVHVPERPGRHRPRRTPRGSPPPKGELLSCHLTPEVKKKMVLANGRRWARWTTAAADLPNPAADHRKKKSAPAHRHTAVVRRHRGKEEVPPALRK